MYQLTARNDRFPGGVRDKMGKRAVAGPVSRYSRLIFTLLVVILGVILTLNLTSFGGRPVEYIKVEISRGDTLWSIASRHTGNETDPRRLISRIKDINQLEDVILQPGQVIKIPLG